MVTPIKTKNTAQKEHDRLFNDILGELPHFCTVMESMRELLIANLVMIGEIPAPTFGEQARMNFLSHRFSEIGLQQSATDDIGNAFAILPGKNPRKNILVVAHGDTHYDQHTDHTISVTTNRVMGVGVADNSLSLAVLATLPSFLETLDIGLEANLIFMSDTRSIGHGNLEGLRFFLDNNTIPIQAAICIESVQLGRLSFGSTGMIRGEIHCVLPDEYDWTRYGATNTIIPLCDVIHKITKIPLPVNPNTQIIMGSFTGGHSFNKIATDSTLRFEIRSESDAMVEAIHEKIHDIITETSAHTSATLSLDILARRKSGGLPVGHPLVRRTNAIIRNMGIQPLISPSTSELSAFIPKKIPAVTIGITKGENLREKNEFIRIPPLTKGIAQLIALLMAIDKGCCDAH